MAYEISFMCSPGTGPILEAMTYIVIPQASITVSGKCLRIEFE